MVDPNLILFANEKFYAAFNARDINLMENLWSRHTPPVCIHPGWSALFNRNEILQSWKDIFENQDVEPRISCHEPRLLYQQDIFSVICFERLTQGWLVATNNFVLESNEVRLFHHQASQCLNPPSVVHTERPQ
ncbi:MAG: nuclear transport factor 2 family protein [Pseudomonadota bacterium]